MCPYYCGLGWFVRPANSDAVWFHGGGMPGTSSNLVRTPSGFSYAAVFNMQPREVERFQIESDELLFQAPGVFQITVEVPDVEGEYAVTVHLAGVSSPGGPHVIVRR
jgi:hypothetical protein